MSTGDNLKRDGRPSLLQIRYLIELKKLQPVKRGFQVVIAERCHVSRPGINKSLKKAIEQGCKAIVIDLDKNMHRFNVKRLATHLQWRQKDFENGVIERCYVIYSGKSVVITADDIARKRVADILETLKP